MNVSLRPLEDRDLDTIYQQVTDPESVRMAAFTAEDQTDRRAFLNRMSRLRADTVFGYHDVKDKDHWLASPKREEFFGPLGVTNIRTFVDPENPTRVGVLMEVRDMDAVMAAMETEAAAEAMEYDGGFQSGVVYLQYRTRT